ARTPGQRAVCPVAVAALPGIRAAGSAATIVSAPGGTGRLGAPRFECGGRLAGGAAPPRRALPGDRLAVDGGWVRGVDDGLVGGAGWGGAVAVELGVGAAIAGGEGVVTAEAGQAGGAGGGGEPGGGRGGGGGRVGGGGGGRGAGAVAAGRVPRGDVEVVGGGRGAAAGVAVVGRAVEG